MHLACRRAREAYEEAKEQSSKGAPSAEEASPFAAAEPAHAGVRSQAGMQPALAEKLTDMGVSSLTASQDTRALGKDAGTEDTAKPAGSGPEMGAPPESKPPPLTKEEKAAAAKERFLARKRKAPA